jgi:hypothetical protein
MVSSQIIHAIEYSANPLKFPEIQMSCLQYNYKFTRLCISSAQCVELVKANNSGAPAPSIPHALHRSMLSLHCRIGSDLRGE